MEAPSLMNWPWATCVGLNNANLRCNAETSARKVT